MQHAQLFAGRFVDVSVLRVWYSEVVIQYDTVIQDDTSIISIG